MATKIDGIKPFMLGNSGPREPGWVFADGRIFDCLWGVSSADGECYRLKDKSKCQTMERLGRGFIAAQHEDARLWYVDLRTQK